MQSARYYHEQFAIGKILLNRHTIRKQQCEYHFCQFFIAFEFIYGIRIHGSFTTLGTKSFVELKCYSILKRYSMNQIKEPSRSIPVVAETDVLVVGSGPGGLSAALAAAREGIDTMLIDRHGCFGGNITQAGVESIAWYRHEETVEAGGIGKEFENRAKEMGGSRKEPQSLSEALDTEMFKYVADAMVQEAGITPLLHCFGVQAIKEGNTIKGVITESKSGRQAILAKRIIDASGDADIAALAGAPYRQAPSEELLGVTVTFGCSGVDVDRFLKYVTQNPSRLGDWDEVEETTGKEDNLFSPY
jgi:hypothetical protein